MASMVVEVKLERDLEGLPDEHRLMAERRAEEAYVMTLLRQGDISAGRAGELLGVNRWELDALMSQHGISPFDESLTRDDLQREAREAGEG